MKFRLVLVFFLIFLVSFFIWQGIYLPRSEPNVLLRGLPKDLVGEKKLFSVERGQSLFQIAENLKNENLIKNKFLFGIFVFIRGKTKSLQAGRYLLSPSMTIPEIAEKFVSGDVIKEKITIIEGWNKKEIASYLEKKGIVNEEKFLIALKLNWEAKYEFLKDKPVNLDIDGYLYPDTYYVDYTLNSTIVENRVLTKEEKIIEKMLDNFDKKLTLELREEIEAQDKTIFEIVTMASLLEKEVKTLEEKKMVSGILWKRLKNKIPLQVDCAITYITGKKTTKISEAETEIDSPYNTYRYLGLPIGPISNPGFESIIAAIYPKDSEYWYYLSTPEGETIFSRTLKEHNIAKAKYLK